MKTQVKLLVLLLLLFMGVGLPVPAAAGSSHARIVRLSLVQGDVRFAPDFHKDSLNDSKATWEIAPLNLPIRQGFAVATDGNGRAEVEFENGAMAFLSANTVIEFYDLSRQDGAAITRLVLRQGSAIFYVHPASGDYFSVTGGDFSVEASGRSRFRLDNFDDGSNLSVDQGRVNVLRGNQVQALSKGQSFAVNVNEGSKPVIGRAGDGDNFDKWVSGRIDSVATATAYSSGYVNSVSYTSGFADLYQYGSWYNIPGYGYGWQPYGVGVGWNPFFFGNWYFDSNFGMSFISTAPWGWLPYHFGGWVSSPLYGWVWVPSGFGFGGPAYYSPMTAVWVHSGATAGVVPLHPSDRRGRTPLNLNQGIYAVRGNTLGQTPLPTAGERWSVMNRPSRNVLPAMSLASTAPPTRVSRTILSSNSENRAATFGHDSSITYDPGQHRYVNSNGPAKASPGAMGAQEGNSQNNRNLASRAAVGGPPRSTTVPAAPPRAMVPLPPRPTVAPPTPPTSYGGSSRSPSGGFPPSSGGATWGGSRSPGSAPGSTGSAGSARGSSSGSSAHGSSSHR